jgi:diadenosine tetraphosphatase ApaH/serine/threonine PP2A family protein phosphatase
LSGGRTLLYAVVGDIHSNFEALDTVLNDIKENGADKVLSVGDVVGYAAEPSRCLSALRKVTDSIVAGNHDYAAVGKMDIDYFNPQAKEAVLWTKEHLKQGDRDFLSALPLTKETDDFTLAHGTLYEPDQFYYLQTFNDASRCFAILRNRICFIGHSHVPAVIVKGNGAKIRNVTKEEVSLRGVKQAIVNVGSVGQPRDGDPRSCYVLYDTETELIRFRRLEYDIDGASKKIIDAGLPEFEAERLQGGF